MVAWTVANMGGEVPKMDPRLLGPAQAAEAWNVDTESGPLDGLSELVAIKDMRSVPGTIARAYRIPGPQATDGEVWLPLPSPFSSAVRSPLVNDSLHRVYWTNPDDGAYWSTYARIRDGLTPYNLGFRPPDPANLVSCTTSGGTAPNVVPYIGRSYLYTFVDEYGLESGPSAPSAVVEGASDGNWFVRFNYTLPPADGKTYPLTASIRLYRTVSGQGTGAQFYRVKDVPIDPDALFYYFEDSVLDKIVVYNLPLESTGWLPPPDKLDGLTVMPGGYFVGFTDNTLHFCEPDRPHAWPAAYDVAVQYKIVGLGVWNQTLMVLTQGYPSSGTGNTPGAFTLAQVQVAEPCIARGSIVTDLLGVYYASQNGLVMLSYYGLQNQTLATMTKNLWLSKFRAREIIACRHRNQYLALNAPGAGFMIDYSEQRLGVVQLDMANGATCIWNDIHTGDAYVMANKMVYRWDTPDAPPMAWRWKSKLFVLAKSGNLGACQVTAGPEILTRIRSTISTDAQYSAIDIPWEVNLVFRLYADGRMVWERSLYEVFNEFRLPSGFKAFEYQFELMSRVPVFRVEIGSVMKELRGAS